MYLTINCHYTATVNEIDSLHYFVQELMDGKHQIDENFGRIVHGPCTRKYLDNTAGVDELYEAIKTEVMKIVEHPKFNKMFKDQKERSTNKWHTEVPFMDRLDVPHPVTWWFKDEWDARAKAEAERQGFLWDTWKDAMDELAKLKREMLSDTKSEAPFSDPTVYKFCNLQWGISDKDGLVDGSRDGGHRMNKSDMNSLIKWAEEQGLEAYEIFVEDALNSWENYECYFNDWDVAPQLDHSWVCVTLYRKGIID